MPLNYLIMLQKCSKWEDVSPDERDSILREIPGIVEEARWKGFVSDEYLQAAIPDIQLTEITNMSERTINQQRGLWFNGEASLAMRREQEERRRAQAEQQARRQQAQLVKKAVDLVVQNIVPKLRLYDPLSDGRVRCVGCFENRKITKRMGDDDGWRGCPVEECEFFFCQKKGCHTKLLSHMKQCLAAKTRQDIQDNRLHMSK